MHPKYSTTVPVFPSVPEMKADEAEIVAEHGGVVQQEDGRGAVCEDLDRVLCKAIARAHAVRSWCPQGRTGTNTCSCGQGMGLWHVSGASGFRWGSYSVAQVF
jgi:hypothetical protein